MIARQPSISNEIEGEVDRLVLVLGDQLDHDSPLLSEIDHRHDAVLMTEVREESTHVPSHRKRTALFLSAMRHFAQSLERRNIRVRYVRLDDPANTQSFSKEIRRAIAELHPSSLLMVRPGEHRIHGDAATWTRRFNIEVESLEDLHFLTDLKDFQAWMEGRSRPIMDHFYREQRRRLAILTDEKGKPFGGSWNYDSENREAFREAPTPPALPRFRVDKTTRDVTELVGREFADGVGSLEAFNWPVTRGQAKRALADFIRNRLPFFGSYQDAMWAGEPFLYHSLLSPALNLKLLNPREVVAAALEAFEAGRAPLNAVEGFVRQIIGWREYIRGVYWTEGPAYADRNALHSDGRLPNLYWTGETDMNCLRESVGQVLTHGYGHHIQRLMVTGNFALICGVSPREISDWYLGMFVDGIDWVTLPNTLGMVMHADGGIVGTKPYAASGRYIDRMSNYCGGCRYIPTKRTGEDACPFTTFFWAFLLRHEKTFVDNPRMRMMMRNVKRLGRGERQQIRRQADEVRRTLTD